MADLDTLVIEIRAEIKAYQRCIKKGLLHAKRIGEYLLEARKAVDAAGLSWLEWLDTNFTATFHLGYKTATRYMKVAENIDKFNAADLANLSVPKMLERLADKSSDASKPAKSTAGKSNTAKPDAAPKAYSFEAVRAAAAELGIEPADLTAVLFRFGVKVRMPAEVRPEHPAAEPAVQVAVAV